MATLYDHDKTLLENLAGSKRRIKYLRYVTEEAPRHEDGYATVTVNDRLWIYELKSVQFMHGITCELLHSKYGSKEWKVKPSPLGLKLLEYVDAKEA